MSSETSILSDLHEAIKGNNLRELSKGIEMLRSKQLLTDANEEKLNSWIEEYFPLSLVAVAKSLFEPEEDEKEQEEKLPAIHPKNVCSADTQQDLLGDPLPTMEQVITFLLPKSKKSECITETDMSKIVGSRADEVYLYDISKNEILTSVLVYRLPTSGIWIVGHPMYLRIFRTYQLESFGKHTISAARHVAGSIWRQEHELFLAKPLHWNGFTSFIRDNVSLPTLSACACMFKPEEDDWSEAARYSFSVDKCEWMIPTWNGIPIFLGKICGEVLSWNYKELIVPKIGLKSLTKFDKATVDEISTVIDSLRKSVDKGNLYIETNQSRKITVKSFAYKFTWKFPGEVHPLNISVTMENFEEVSARLGAWPSKIGMEMATKNKVKGLPVKIGADTQTLLNIGQIRLENNTLVLDWILDISNTLPKPPQLMQNFIPGSMASLIGFLSAQTANDKLVMLVQEEVRVPINLLISAALTYGDEYTQHLLTTTEDPDETSIISAIKENYSIHGPALRLLMLFSIDGSLDIENPTEVVFRNRAILSTTTEMVKRDVNDGTSLIALKYIIKLII